MRHYPFDLGKVVRSMFPDQTNSFLSIILWTLLYIVDLALVFAVAWWLGFDILAAANKRTLFIYLAIAMVPFLLEVWLFDKIRGNA